VRFWLIQAHSECFSIAWSWKQLGVARSGFYAWRQRQRNPGLRAQENSAITALIQTAFHRHRGFFDAPRLHQEPEAADFEVGRYRVARPTHPADLKAKIRRGFKPCHTADPQPDVVADNLLSQQFSPTAPNRSWGGDITYIRTTAGWRYLAM